jgi:uncharacterized membrane protein
MPARLLPTVVKLLVLCLVVGLLLTFFDITPKDLLTNFWRTVRNIWQIAVDTAEWAWKYIALGAVVVLPIWLLAFLLKRFRR